LGSEDYIKAFVDLDMDILGSDKMVEAFTQFKRVLSYVDDDAPGRKVNFLRLVRYPEKIISVHLLWGRPENSLITSTVLRSLNFTMKRILKRKKH